MGNPIPSQERSVDPYSSYNSDVVNKLTRIISDGENILLTPTPIDASIADTTTVSVSAGKCLKDDVLIEIQDIDIDMTDEDFYVDSSGGVWNETGYYYLVLEYEYQKTSPPPEASIKVIMDSQRSTVYDSSKHLFIKCLEITGSYQVTTLYDYDPDDPTLTRSVKGAGSGNYVKTDGDTTGLGAGLYSVGTSDTDRFDEIWCATLNADTISGSASEAKYADLAEKYTIDPDYPLELGAVVEMSGCDEFEIQECDTELSPFVMGVISTAPAYLMNKDLKDSMAVGLVGRLPVKVIGPVFKKDILVSAGDGCLRAAVGTHEYPFKVGMSLETNDEDGIRLVECFIK